MNATDDDRRWHAIVEQLLEQGTPREPQLLPLRWRAALVVLWLGVGLVWWVLLIVLARWALEL